MILVFSIVFKKVDLVASSLKYIEPSSTALMVFNSFVVSGILSRLTFLKVVGAKPVLYVKYSPLDE